jgi:patatin-like phospholipase/acyl hydrolase
VVTLDGGGIRGMITLGLLQALERQLAGAVTTITEIPNLITGTSVGIYHSHIFQVPLCFTTSGEVEASTAMLMRRGQVL